MNGVTAQAMLDTTRSLWRPLLGLWRRPVNYYRIAARRNALVARYECYASHSGRLSESSKVALRNVEKELEHPAANEEDAWNSLFRAEQLMVFVFNEKTLDSVIKTADEGALKKLTSIEDKRIWLSTWIEELHADQVMRILRRRYLCRGGRWAMLLFVLAIMVVYYETFFPVLLEIDFVRFDCIGSKASLTLTVGGVGALGALFSMLVNFNKMLLSASLEDIERQTRLGVIAVRLFIGIGAGVLMLNLLQGGIVTSGLLPQFERSDDLLGLGARGTGCDQVSLLRNSEYGKLFVLGFLAGFSERLVPSALLSTARSFSRGNRSVG